MTTRKALIEAVGSGPARPVGRPGAAAPAWAAAGRRAAQRFGRRRPAAGRWGHRPLPRCLASAPADVDQGDCGAKSTRSVASWRGADGLSSDLGRQPGPPAEHAALAVACKVGAHGAAWTKNPLCTIPTTRADQFKATAATSVFCEVRFAGPSVSAGRAAGPGAVRSVLSQVTTLEAIRASHRPSTPSGDQDAGWRNDPPRALPPRAGRVGSRRRPAAVRRAALVQRLDQRSPVRGYRALLDRALVGDLALDDARRRGQRMQARHPTGTQRVVGLDLDDQRGVGQAQPDAHGGAVPLGAGPPEVGCRARAVLGSRLGSPRLRARWHARPFPPSTAGRRSKRIAMPLAMFRRMPWAAVRSNCGAPMVWSKW